MFRFIQSEVLEFICNEHVPLPTIFIDAIHVFQLFSLPIQVEQTLVMHYSSGLTQNRLQKWHICFFLLYFFRLRSRRILCNTDNKRHLRSISNKKWYFLVIFTLTACSFTPNNFVLIGFLYQQIFFFSYYFSFDSLVFRRPKAKSPKMIYICLYSILMIVFTSMR